MSNTSLNKTNKFKNRNNKKKIITLKSNNRLNNNNNNGMSQLTIKNRIKTITGTYKVLINERTCEIISSSLEEDGLIIDNFIPVSSSGTKAALYFLKYKKHNLFVKKILYEEEYYEMNIYKLLYYFLKFKISPHVITGIHNIYCETEGQKFELLFTETFDKDIFQVISFLEFIELYKDNPKFYLLILNLLFQIIYTLICFNLIYLYHHDLHSGNILVCINKGNNIFMPNFTPTNFTSYIYNTNGESIKLLDLGISIYIFDFNTSHKVNIDTSNMENNTIKEQIRKELKSGDINKIVKFSAEVINSFNCEDIQTFFAYLGYYYKNSNIKYVSGLLPSEYLEQILLPELTKTQTEYLSLLELDLTKLIQNADSFNIRNIYN